MDILHHKVPNGFTILEVLAIIFIGAVLAIVLMPYFVRPRGCIAMKLNCVNNQKQIGVAFLTWALDNHEKFPMQVSVANGGTMELVKTKVVFPHFEVMSNELSTPRILFCPEDSNPERKAAEAFGRTIQPSWPNTIRFASDTNLSYFVGVDAINRDSGMILCGDDNFTFERMRLRHRLVPIFTNSTVEWTAQTHAGKGNICFADGYVEQLNTPNLNEAIQRSQLRNRLAMP